MTIENLAELKERAEEVMGRKIYGRITVTDDTSNYMKIGSGTVLRLHGTNYFVSGDATEGRFGIGDQPKFWVKYAWDLTTGKRKIIKLVFYESFTTTMGFFTFRLTRNPDKESKVLELVRGDDRFMQGQTLHDRSGNNIRIVDFIKGQSLYNEIAALEMSHARYFHELMPEMLRKVVGSVEALDHLAKQGQQHGDVRNDHILVERGTGAFRWIDFDYEVNYGDYDVWSVGNVLNYVVGMGVTACRDVVGACTSSGSPLGPDDALLFFKHRLANLRKVYPYIPKELNEVLMRFSTSTVDFYEDVGTIARDLRGVLAKLP